MAGRIALVAGAMLVLGVSSAAADRIFQFEFTGVSPRYVALAVSGRLSLTDAGFATGIAISEFGGPGGQSFDPALPGPDWRAAGLAGLDVSVEELGSPGGRVALSLGVLPGGGGAAPPPEWLWSVALESRPRGIPSGVLTFNDTASDFGLVLAGLGSSGTFNSDGGIGAYAVPDPRTGMITLEPGCGIAGVCSFSGTFSAVPEPAGLALLALGLAGVAIVRRRRWHAPT